MFLRTIACVGVAVVASIAPAAAQDEAALKSFFEGRRVVLRIDMPGTSEGVNVLPERGGEMDVQDYRHRLSGFPTAIHAGDAVVVTLVKVKKDLIEFQLAGGGFGTFWDDTSTSPDLEYREKSNGEKELERRIRDEDDQKRRRELQRELEELRERRERENRRIAVERERQSEMKAQRVAYERSRGGSRFNLRYDRAVPPEITPGQIMSALAEYVDFGFAPEPGGYRQEIQAPTAADITALRKGMTRQEVEHMFGRPVSQSERREGSFAVTTIVYEVAEQRVSIDLIDDVVVRYTISSK